MMEVLAAFKPVKFKLYNDEESVQRVLFIRHGCEEGKLRKASMSKTLLVIGIPYFIGKDTLIEMFAPFGNVLNVRLIDLNCKDKLDEPTSSTPKLAETEANESSLKNSESEDSSCCKGAEIEFENETSVQNFLADADSLLLIASPKSDLLCAGMKKWCENYSKSIVEPNKLKDKVINIITAYDKRKELEKQKTLAMEEKDQDGWTLVTKANKRRARKVLDAKTEQKSTPNDFYAFKKEEAKLEQLATLKRKYEEDKQRLVQLKSNRKFKPE